MLTAHQHVFRKQTSKNWISISSQNNHKLMSLKHTLRKQIWHNISSQNNRNSHGSGCVFIICCVYLYTVQILHTNRLILTSSLKKRTYAKYYLRSMLTSANEYLPRTSFETNLPFSVLKFTRRNKVNARKFFLTYSQRLYDNE